MTPQEITAIIQLIIAPVVMISACSIFVNGLLSRYAAVNDRIRMMAHERLELRLGSPMLPQAPLTPFAIERLTEIDYQLPRLLGRHKLLRNSVLLLYIAVLLFVADMFVIATASFFSTALSATVVLVVFLIGTSVFFVGVLLAVLEVRNSHLTVSYEAQRIVALTLTENDTMLRASDE